MFCKPGLYTEFKEILGNLVTPPFKTLLGMWRCEGELVNLWRPGFNTREY